MSVNCVYCGHVNPDGSTVCQSCGRTLPPPASGSYGQQPWGAPQQGEQQGSYPPPDPYGSGWQQGGQGGAGSYGQQQPPSYGQQPQQPGYGDYGQPGYGQYGQGQSSWGAPAGGAIAGGYNNPAVSDAQSSATKAMIFSIVGVICCQLLGIVGIVMGGKAKSTLQQYGVQEGQTQATVAIVLGWVALGLFVLGIIIQLLAAMAS